MVWPFKRQKSPRHIFTYHDGARTRHADPVVAWTLLESACGGDPQELLKRVASGPPAGTVGAMLGAFRKAQDEAVKKLAAAVCDALGVAPLSDSGGKPAGLTVGERVALVVQFIDFLGGLAQRATPFPSSPPPTAASRPA